MKYISAAYLCRFERENPVRGLDHRPHVIQHQVDYFGCKLGEALLILDAIPYQRFPKGLWDVM